MENFQIIIDILQGIILGFFTVQLLDLKINNRKNFYLLLMCLIYSLEIIFFDYVYVYEGFYSLIYSITIFGCSSIISKNNNVELLIYALLFNVLISVGNCFAILFMRIVFQSNIEMILNNIQLLNITSIIVCISMAFFAIFITVIGKKYISILVQNSKYYLFAFFIFYISITCVEELIFIYYPLEDKLLMIYFILIFLFIFLIFLFVKNIEDTVHKMNYTLVSKQFNLLKERFGEFDESAKKIQVLKHDLKKSLYVLKKLTENGEYDKILNYLNEQLEIVEYNPSISYTGNHIIDCILSSKSLHCKDEKIVFTYSVDKNCLGYIDVLDMSILLLNGLDNAIENVSIKHRNIYLSIKKKANILQIRIENYVDYDVLKSNPKLKTQKEDSQFHGFGIASIKMIAEKYKGYVAFGQDDDLFCCLITIPMIDENYLIQREGNNEICSS